MRTACKKTAFIKKWTTICKQLLRVISLNKESLSLGSSSVQPPLIDFPFCNKLSTVSARIPRKRVGFFFYLSCGQTTNTPLSLLISPFCTWRLGGLFAFYYCLPLKPVQFSSLLLATPMLWKTARLVCSSSESHWASNPPSKGFQLSQDHSSWARYTCSLCYCLSCSLLKEHNVNKKWPANKSKHILSSKEQVILLMMESKALAAC